jgi:hypothetical protein
MITFALKANENYCYKGFKYAIFLYIGTFFWIVSFTMLTVLTLRLS